ncbi:hypothetical protein TWF281_008494 [Arthrobotrys megalospora]
MSNFTSRVTNFQAQEDRTKAILAASKSHIYTIGPNCTEKTTLALESAMMRIYKLAVFIRGDFDNRPLDEEQQSNLSNQAVEGFMIARKLAEGGVDALSAHHSTVGL